jgi:hypothetical protein
MHRLRYLILLAAFTTVGLAKVAYPCSALRSSAMIDTFECFCPEDPQQEQQIPIFVVSGAISLNNRQATPTLGSIVVEIDKRIGNTYTPVARQVLNEMGDPMVHTCLGSLMSDPPSGNIVLTDAAGHLLDFGDVKNLPEGRFTVHYIATFAGVTNLALGDRVRIKVFTTAIGVHGTGTCTVDADGDGFDDVDVKTLKFQKSIRIPTFSNLITPPIP